MTTEWGSVTTADPYARAAGVNGARSMIVDLARTDPPGWEQDKRPVIPASKRSVWEVNVRDFSQDPASGVRNAWRGKFLAFTQQGTTLNCDGVHPTCLTSSGWGCAMSSSCPSLISAAWMRAAR